MCTALTYKTKDFYFGRTLDYEVSWNEEITVTPREYPLTFRHSNTMKTHYAMIGMACGEYDYPLYFDAVNEKGLAMACLNFPEFAEYKPFVDGFDNIAPFEFIPWILGQCANVSAARVLLSRVNLIHLSFSEELPLTPLHWIISDAEESITVESAADGLHIYNNPAGVLTNSPPFPYQMLHLSNYMGLSAEPVQNHFAQGLTLPAFSNGMGAAGLPGDLSSPSRFVRAAFTKLNSVSGNTEAESVSQFFHILGSVSQTRGCVHLGGKSFEITIYSSCCNASRGIYYYTTYENSQVSAVDMHRENLDGYQLVRYPLVNKQQIFFQN